MTGRYPRAAGWFVALTWAWYQYVAFAYGKVDHDRGDFVLALLLLPTVGTAHLHDKRLSEAAGFAIRAVQLGAIATYFLSGVAKLRFGGPEWVNSATLVRAVVRRGHAARRAVPAHAVAAAPEPVAHHGRRAAVLDDLLPARALATADGARVVPVPRRPRTRRSPSRSGRTW